MYLPTQDDIGLLFQSNKQVFIKLHLLNMHFQIIDELQGELTEGAATIDSSSDIRRVASFTFHVKDRAYYADQSSNIWLDKAIDLYIGLYHNLRREILWYPLGCYIFNKNGFRYDATTKNIFCSCVDLMGYFTGLRAGALRGISTQIPRKSVITNVVKSTITQLGNVHNYLIDSNINPDYLTVPFDIDFRQGVTVYEILKRIADIYPAVEFYFDINKTFRWTYIPMATNDIIMYDDSLLQRLLINENTERLDKDFSQIKNCIEVWGKDDLSARLVLVNKMPDIPDPDYNYKVDPDSPFSVEMIGKEVWDIKSGGEYSHIYTEELALDRCKHELFLATAMQDRINLHMMLIPFMDVNQKFSYTNQIDNENHQYITKRINFDLTSCTMQVDSVKFTPLYSWL